MAKKAKAVKKQKRAVAKLPAGFTAVGVSGEFGEWQDWTKNPILTGKVVALGSFEGEYGKQRTMTVQNGKKMSAFSESSGTRGLFDIKNIKGKTVFVQYLGTIPVGKKRKNGTQKTFKQFTCAVKE